MKNRIGAVFAVLACLAAAAHAVAPAEFGDDSFSDVRKEMKGARAKAGNVFGSSPANAANRNVRVYVLLGGLFGSEGYVVSLGMVGLAGRLAALPGVYCTTHNWNEYPLVAYEIRHLPPEIKVVIVGYSGGGSRATWIANAVGRRKIDLLVTYDPSPTWQMQPLHANVKSAIDYYNRNPMFFGLGGGILTGRQVRTIEISEPHMYVQVDPSLHRRTINAVAALTK